MTNEKRSKIAELKYNLEMAAQYELWGGISIFGKERGEERRPLADFTENARDVIYNCDKSAEYYSKAASCPYISERARERFSSSAYQLNGKARHCIRIWNDWL